MCSAVCTPGIDAIFVFESLWSNIEMQIRLNVNSEAFRILFYVFFIYLLIVKLGKGMTSGRIQTYVKTWYWTVFV